MARYIFAYHGGSAPTDPSEVEKAMAQWGAWYESIGARLSDGGGPAGPSSTVTHGAVSDDGGSNPLSGFTVVEADTKEDAIEMAKGCPMVTDGSGSVEVCEVIVM